MIAEGYSEHTIGDYIHRMKTKTSNLPNITEQVGMKFDEDKPRYGLLPEKALLEIVKNLTFGAKKYAPGNWKLVERADERYFDAAQRHIWAWKSGEVNDPENNLHHLAAAAVNLMFILDAELSKDKNAK